MDKYNQYALLVSQKKEIEAKEKVLRKEILADMQANKKDKQEVTLGKFSIVRTKEWTYPKYVLDLEEEYKAKKELSVSTNEATYEEVEILKFNLLKL
jgi:hypothetical protein